MYTYCIVLILQVRVSLSQSYPGSEDRIDRSCLLDISPPAPRIVVNVTTTVEDIVWQNLGAVITGISAHWSLQNTTASTDPATLMYQYDIGDNTSSHSDPLEFSQVGDVPYGLHCLLMCLGSIASHWRSNKFRSI